MELNWALILPILAIQLLLLVIALVDLLRREEDEINGSKIIWAIVILLASMIGPIIYFVLGKRRD